MRQQKTAKALELHVTYQVNFDLAGFAQKQEQQMDTMLGLVAKRQQAGDMGQADSELAYMSLSQRLNATTEARAQLKQVTAQIEEILPQWTVQKGGIPASFWQIKTKELRSADLEQLPVVASAKAQYNAISQQAKLTALASKIEPTIGLNGGRDCDEGVVVISLSVPLNVRNNYQEDKKAASLGALAAKQAYQALKRQYHFANKAAFAVLQEYKVYYQRWQKLMGGRSESGGKLLKQQWESGDLSTTEYLLALDQITEGMMAGIVLRSQYQQAVINWLLVSGQLPPTTYNLK